MSFRDITVDDVLRAQSRAVGGGRKRCQKGKACSATCIDPSESCLVEFPAPVSSGLSKVASKVDGSKEKDLTQSERDFVVKMRDDFKKRKYEKIQESLRWNDEISYNKARKEILEMNAGLPKSIDPVKVPMAWEKVKKIEKAYDKAIDNIFSRLERARFQQDTFKFGKEALKLHEMYTVLGAKLGKENQTKYAKWSSYPDSKFLSKLYSSDLKGARITYNGEDLIINKKIGKNTISVRFGDYGLVFDFKVNGDFSVDPSVSSRDRRRIAFAARDIFNQIVKSMDEGSVVTVTPYGGDGKGGSRRDVYNAYGFRDGPGEGMYGKVKRGKIVGATEDDYYNYVNRGKFNLPSD